MLLVDGVEEFDGFYFYDDLVFDQHVGAETGFEVDGVVDEGDGVLPLYFQAALLEVVG